MYQAALSRRCLSRTGVLAHWLLLKLSYVLGLFYTAVIGLLILVVAYEYAVWVRPLLYDALNPVTLQLHTVISLVLLLSVAVNYIAALVIFPGSPAHTVDPEVGPTKPDVGEKSAADGILRTNSQLWRWCSICKAAKPPRAHHCRMCGTCYLRHCHHCPALSRCVGQNNYPFYWRFIAAACTGSLFLALTCALVLRNSSGNLPSALMDLLFFTAVIAVSVAVSILVLLVWHLYLIYTGQTTIECYENWAVRRSGATPSSWTRWGGPFDKGFRLNIRDAFGDPPSQNLPWWSVLILPCPRRFASNFTSELTSP